MADIFKKLSDASYVGMSEYMNVYTSNIEDILPLNIDNYILKSQINSSNISNEDSLLRFSLVFNDLTFLTCVNKNENNNTYKTLKKEWFEKKFGSSDVKINISRQENENLKIPSEPSFYPSFIYSNGNGADALAKNLQPFIERGKVLLQPDKAILLLRNDGEPGNRKWGAISTEHSSSMLEWGISDGANSRQIPLNYQMVDYPNSKSMFDITIPYLEGVDYSDLAKIIDDEGDLISSLRVSILDAINELEEGVDSNIIARDIIDPKLDMLSKKFKLIINSQAFRVAGAAVCSVAMSYTAVATSGVSVGILGSAGGLGLLGREYSLYKEKLDKLKEDPYYFLWKCKKLSKSN